MNIEKLAAKPYVKLTTSERRLLGKYGKQQRLITRALKAIEKNEERVKSITAEVEICKEEIAAAHKSIEEYNRAIEAIEDAYVESLGHGPIKTDSPKSGSNSSEAATDGN